ncbi:MAG TPA: cytochrome C oxidase subunit IV family protein [Blastocatellia bacterium]|nr:cytochrome C oxidase subunit IV family protein [Blastocatellia bacterium]
MSEHIVSVKSYVGVFISLLILTGLTVLVAWFDLGRLNTVVALTIAIVKATLVVLFFMHLYYSSKLTKVIMIASLFWLAIMISLTLGDYLSRGHDPMFGPR